MSSSISRRITSHDVAVHAGVSQSTVSRVLTGNVKVSDRARERVLRSLQELQYEPNSAARTMKTGRTGQIGVVMSAITNPFHQELLREVSRRLVASGLNPVVWYVDHGADVLAVQAIRQGGVDGVIHTSATPNSAALEAAIDRKLPTVLLHRTVDDARCDQVAGDNWRGGHSVAQYFAENGHARIAMVSGAVGLSTTREREMGFRAGLREHGLEIDPNLMIRGHVVHATGVDAATRLLTAPEPPTAIFATSDLIGFGVIDGARAIGARVPEDLWVVGFDNTEMASWESFTMTSVDQPRLDMVEAAVDLIIDQLKGSRRPPRQLVLPCQLIVRASTANVQPRAQRHSMEADARPREARDAAPTA